VVVPWTFRAAGREGLKLEANVTMAFTLRDGLIARISMFQTKDEAFEGAGLSE
jgi:ketosteroid isomerase-like protein